MNQPNMLKMKNLIVALILLCNIHFVFAQGDGPRNLLWAPKGVTALIPKYMHLSQNITPGNVLIKDADITIDVYPITLVHNFGLGNRWAQIMFSAVPGKVSGRLESDKPGLPAPNYSSSGMADGFVGFKMGLINQPALNVMEYAKFKQKFSMMLYTRLWYSGSYNKNNPLSLGTNRLTWEIGFPMDIQLSTIPKRPTWLEIYPALHMYTPNNSPTTISKALKSQQKALFSLESHLTHNFADKFWAGVDLRYQYGGALELDGVNQNNKINILGGGFVAGYQVLSMLGLSAGYGSVFAGDNGARSNMLRLTAVLSYVNLKKLKASQNK